MVYRTDSTRIAIKRSISGRPLRGMIRRYAPPSQRLRQPVVSPVRYIGAQNLNIHLPELLRSAEHLQAAVYGEAADGMALFAVTSERVLIVVQSASRVRAEEIVLGMVAGVDLKRHGALTLLTVFTNSDTHTIRTLDRAAARHFAECVDVRCQTRHIEREMS